MSTLLYHPAFTVIPLLRGNSDANNQSNLRNFSAYIINDENSCPYCKEPDSILHTFAECHFTQTFYLKVVDRFNAKFNRAFSPTPLETLFGTDLNTSRNNELKLNYCLLFAKYYLYYQKMYCKA